MKRKIRESSFALLLSFLLGCTGIHEDHLVDRYYLIAVDSELDALTLSYQLESGDFIGVVEPTVFEVGYNRDFIIVKQHPRAYSNSAGESITNYFVVPIKNKVHQSPDENKIGPLRFEQFVKTRKDLKVPDNLTFTREFKN